MKAKQTFLRLVGLILLVAAAPKVRHPASFRSALTGYHLFPLWTIPFLNYAVPIVEVGLALALFLGRRRAVVLSCGLFTSFTLILLWSWTQGLTLTCGCFGRVDRFLHQLPHGLMIHVLLNAATAAGLLACAGPLKEDVSTSLSST